MTVVAAPRVVGYERFHAGVPSAAGGAVLYSELGCANCHGGSAVVIPRKGPSLENIASRVNHAWVMKFLNAPAKTRDGSTMPSLLHAMQEDDIEAIAAYLSTYGPGLSLNAPRHVNPGIGKELYQEKGCLACHAPAASETSSPGTIAFPDLTSKTSLVALEHFLTHTSRYRPDGRMPHFELGRDGAINVAAHLLGIQGSDPRMHHRVAAWPKADEKQVQRGRLLVEKASCAACHTLPGMEAPKMIPLRSGPFSEEQCLSDEPQNGIPHYSLTADQRESLLAFLSGPRAEKDTEGSLTLKAMNCYACHTRDGVGGPSVTTSPFFHGDKSLGDSGRFPPPLTGIGHKLQRDWLKKVFSGETEKPVRPYLKTAMPAYPGHAESLAEWLTETDTKPDAQQLAHAPDSQEAGRKLLGTQGGVNCITCHHWDNHQSLGIPGLDIFSLNKRLRPEWFRSYLLNPANYRPGTLMPSLWPEGQSTIPNILGGDTEKQIAAIWNFISNGTGVPEGFPNRNDRQFELKPTTRPIVQRTFLKGVGTKAILVGFPGNIHIAYDGEKARPGLVWRGAFFDAYSTWFMRMAPFESPLGKEVYTFPDAKADADAEANGPRRFRGYSLDEAGTPTFLFTEAGRLVRERFEVAEGQLIRSLSWQSGPVPNASHPDSEKITFKEIESPGHLKIIYQWK